jgi:hypothetical protein
MLLDEFPSPTWNLASSLQIVLVILSFAITSSWLHFRSSRPAKMWNIRSSSRMAPPSGPSISANTAFGSSAKAALVGAKNVYCVAT